ncbi:MAG: hypothetical protein IJW01_08090 [Paludibacteraceae bacterium]|nr:hypothetical protein [Paludibacteraceae bacterium]
MCFYIRQLSEQQRDDLVRELVDCMHERLMPHLEEQVIEENLLNRLWSYSHAYDVVTPEALTNIRNDINQGFANLHCITIEDLQNENNLNFCVELYQYVKRRLCDLGIKNPGLRAISDIVNSVFGNMPIITPSVVRQLHFLGYIDSPNSNSFRKILNAINLFYLRNMDDINAILRDLVNIIGYDVVLNFQLVLDIIEIILHLTAIAINEYRYHHR